MEWKVKGSKVAILVADGFQQDEMVEPKKALEQLGIITTIVSPCKGKVKGWKMKNWADEFVVDQELNQAKAEDFDALLLPGGLMSPDTLRTNSDAVNFVKSFVKSGKPIAAICHGPWMLINAEAVKGKTVTSWPAIQLDLMNAGAKWIDREVVQDGNLITSRKPDDIPFFNQAFIKIISDRN